MRPIHIAGSLVLLGASPFSPVSVPSAAMVVWAGGYVAAWLALGVRAFSRRAL